MNWYIVFPSLLVGWILAEMTKKFLKSPEYLSMIEGHEVLVKAVMLAVLLVAVFIAIIVICIKDKRETTMLKESARLYDMERAEELERKKLAKCADWSSIAESEWKLGFPCL